MDESKNRALRTIESLGYKNLFISQEKKTDSFFKPRILVSINDRCMITFNMKGSKLTNQFSWLSLKWIGREGIKLRFQFDKIRFAFEYGDEALFRAISTALQNLLTHSELDAIKFNQFHLPPIKIYPPLSALNRMKERSAQLKVPFYDNSAEAIWKMLVYMKPDINISDIPGIDVLYSIFLDSLPFFSDMQTLTISGMGSIDPYKISLPYLSYFKTLKLIEMDCPKSGEFRTFMNDLKSAKNNSNLFGLSFTMSEFEKNDLEVLHQYIIDEGIKSLELHNAVDRSSMNDFYSFLTPSLMETLTVLNLDHTNSVSNDISIICPKLKNLACISLSDCSVEVSEVLFLFSGFKKLRILNLSNNTCKKIINGIPPSVTTLYLNSVNWYYQTLPLFLANLPRHKLNLHVSNIIMERSDNYKSVFENLKNASSHFLTGLSWNGNVIEKELFDFLGLNKNLQFLSLSDCISRDGEKKALMLAEYLSSFHTVKTLILKGSKKRFLGNLIETVISGILRSPQIEFLDLSGNKSGDFGLQQFRQLFSSSNSIKCFVFDKTKPANIDAYFVFLRYLSQIKNTKISFPIHDAESMLKKGKISPEQFGQLQSFFIQSSRPECVFISYDNNDFPRYLSPSELEELNKEVVEIESPNSPSKSSPGKPKITGQTSNYNYEASKNRSQKSLFGPTKKPSSPPQDKVDDKKTQYLMEQNRKIQKMIPKENDNNFTFDSESASYNIQDSSSNSIFIPPMNYDTMTVKNKPNRVAKSSAKSGKVKKRPRNKAASLAPAKKQVQRKQNTNEDKNRNIAARPNSARKTRKTKSMAPYPNSTRKVKKSNIFEFDEDENSPNDGNAVINQKPRSTKTSSRVRKSPRKITQNNDEPDDYDFFDNMNVRPLLRTRKSESIKESKSRKNREVFRYSDEKFNDDDDGSDENAHLTYQPPDWKFPSKIKIADETETLRRIEDRYSNDAFISAILDDETAKIKPKKKAVKRKKKIVLD